jgi:predicted nucleic acid-binding protein
MIGLDTGFFVELLRKNLKAVEVWEGIMEGDESAVSCLTLCELKRLSLKGAIESDAVNTLLEAIGAICKVVWLEKTEILMEAAMISQAHGIHAMDSLIVAGLSSSKAKTIYTTDFHIEKYKKKGVNVVNMVAGSTS